MVEFADRIAGLAPAKLELLARRLREKRLATASNEQVTPRPSEMNSRAPLSFAQERLWFLNQLEPHSSAYNIFRAVRLTSALNIAALKRSLRETVRRHETLRTTFTEVGGIPMQVIGPPENLNLPLIDLSEVPDSKRESTVAALALDEAQRPFNFARGPLFRIVVVRLSEESYVILFAMHHVISDAWSMELLVREVATLYVAFMNGRPSPLPDLSIQYADFAIWQREWFQGEVLEKQLQYWKQQLGGRLPVLQLPFDGPEISTPTDRGSRQSRSLDADLTGSLKTLCQREGVTLFMLTAAAFQTLLYRYSRQKDIIVGIPVSNRNRVEIEPLIGFFINTLVLRTRFSGNPNFRELLARVREVTLGAYAHCDLPFERLVQALEPQRTMNRTVLFQVALTFRSAPTQSLELPDLALSYLPIYCGKAQFELNMNVIQDEKTLKILLEYKIDLFSDRTISNMLNNFERLLRTAVARPDITLEELNGLLDQLEKQERIIREKELTEVRAQKFRTARRRRFVRS